MGFNNYANEPTIKIDYEDGHKHQSLEQKENKVHENEHKSIDDTVPSHLRQYAPRPTSCNGDCGAAFSTLINRIINPKVMYPL